MWLQNVEDLIGLMFVFFIEYIGVTLVNKTIQVSSVQLNTTSSAPCIVLSLPKVKSLPVTFCHPFALFPFLPTLFPSSNHHTLVCVCLFRIFLTQSPILLLSDSCQSVFCISESVFVQFSQQHLLNRL